MNAKELKDKIRELDLQEDFRSFVHEDFEAPFMVGDVELEWIDSFRGDYGDHDTQFMIFKVGDKYFEVSGYYSSWDGSSYEYMDFYEVKPVEVKKVEYHQV
jgi:hypothetical protein